MAAPVEVPEHFLLPDQCESGGAVLWCAPCLRREFRHDPADPHLHHGASCEGAVVHRAVTVIDGEARCHRCTIDVLSSST